jgi:EAL domain-containing protein (putative c-di-GMP-specific phosphodiesterase class I)
LPFIVELGASVLTEACRRLRECQDLGHVLEISISFSARKLANNHMPEMIAQAIESHGIAAECVKVTESVRAQDIAATSEVIAGLKLPWRRGKTLP